MTAAAAARGYRGALRVGGKVAAACARVRVCGFIVRFIFSRMLYTNLNALCGHRRPAPRTTTRGRRARAAVRGGVRLRIRGCAFSPHFVSVNGFWTLTMTMAFK